jgi:hypothetical protein
MMNAWMREKLDSSATAFAFQEYLFVFYFLARIVFILAAVSFNAASTLA